MKQNALDTLWVEKYRPQSFDEMVLSEKFKRKFVSFVDTQSIPNMMFASGPGTGKSTVARILRDSIIKDDADLLQFNGSSTTGVDNIRKDVTMFLESPPLVSNIKLVYVDEADRMSPAAQDALKGIMEQFSRYGRFLFTINHKSRVSKELFSRVQLFEFEKLPMDVIQKTVYHILDSEKIKYDEKNVNKILDDLYPDVRRAIGVIQMNCVDGVLDYDSSTILNVELKVIELTKNILNAVKSKKPHTIQKSLKDIEKIVFNEYIDFYTLYEQLFILEEMPFWGKIHMGEGLDQLPQAAIPQMSFITALIKVVKSGMAAANQNFYEV